MEEFPELEPLGPFLRRHSPGPTAVLHGMNAPRLLSRSFFSEFSSSGTWILRDAALGLLALLSLGPWQLLKEGREATRRPESNSVSSRNLSNGHLSEEPAEEKKKKMTNTSGPIYHFPIVSNKLLEPLGFEALLLLPPNETNPTKCLSMGTAECWQHCCQLKGFLQRGLIRGGCQGGAVERTESLKWENKGGRTSSKGIKAPREGRFFESVYAQGWAGHLCQNLPLAQA